MSLPTYGTLSISMINTELGRASNTANSSLQQLANLARTGSTPYNNRANPKISDWYGYANSTAISIGTGGDSGHNASCSLHGGGTMGTYYVFGSPTLYRSLTIFTNSELTTRLDGQYKWWYFPSENKTAQISSSGEVRNIVDCNATIYDYTLYSSATEGYNATCSDHSQLYGDVYSSSSSLSVGIYLYMFGDLSMGFPGGGLDYWDEASDQIITIANTGQVTAISACVVPVSSIPCYIDVNYHNYTGGGAEHYGNEFYLYDNTTSTMIYQVYGIPFNISYNSVPTLIVGHQYTVHVRIHDYYSYNWCYSIADLIGNGSANITGSIVGGDDYGNSYHDTTFTITSAYQGDSITLNGYGYIDYY